MIHAGKLIKELEQILDLLPGEIRVIASILHFKSIHMLFTPGNYIGQRTEAWITHRNPHSVIAVLLKELN